MKEADAHCINTVNFLYYILPKTAIRLVRYFENNAEGTLES